MTTLSPFLMPVWLAPVIGISKRSFPVRHDYRLVVPAGVPAWREALNTDAERYGGSGVGLPDAVAARDGELRLTLPPLATVWMAPSSV